MAIADALVASDSVSAVTAFLTTAQVHGVDLRSAFTNGLPDLATADPLLQPLFAPQSRGGFGILAAVLATVAGAALFAGCVLGGCTILAAVAATAALLGGVAWLIDEIIADTAGSNAGCIVRVRQEASNSSNYIYAFAVARCPQTQVTLSTEVKMTKVNQYTVSTSDSCSYTTTCTSTMQNWGWSGTACYYSEGRFTASNGLPYSGEDVTGVQCRAG